MNSKSIDINQRIPLDALHIALTCYLTDSYDENYILEQLKLEFKGENRIKKSLRIINKIVRKNPLNNFILENRDELLLAMRRKEDRNSILITLLNTSFPFSFEVFCFFGKYLSVQEIINTATISKSISNLYGGNRATEIGLYSVIPMFIEAGILNRPKTGLYELNKNFYVNSKIASAIFLESFKLNQNIDSIQDYQLQNPYFKLLNFSKI